MLFSLYLFLDGMVIFYICYQKKKIIPIIRDWSHYEQKRQSERPVHDKMPPDTPQALSNLTEISNI